MWYLFSFILVTIVVALLAYLDTRKPKNFPPGPTWYPIIGSAWELHKLRKKNGLLTKTFSELASNYGALVGVRIGTSRIIYVSGTKAIRELLMRDEFNGKPDDVLYKIRTWGERKGLFFPDPKHWQHQRRFVIRQLKKYRLGKQSLFDLMQEEASIMIKSVKKLVEDKGEYILYVDDFVGTHILSILWTVMTGNKHFCEDKIIRRLQTILTDLFAQATAVGTLRQFPFLRYICPNSSGYNGYVEVHRKLWSFIAEEIEEVKKTNNVRGFMGAYLRELKSSKNEDGFTEDQLLAICLDLFVAGMETSKILKFVFLYLLLHPDVQVKAQEEIDRAIGRERLPNVKDKAQLQYVESIILESLRMYVGRRHAAPHKALKDSYFNGYLIPKDTTLLVNAHSIFLDENSGWVNPEIFNPDRFLNNGMVQIPDHFIAFGLGKHRSNTSQYAHYVFNTLDQDHSGLISFENFVQSLSVLSRGSLDEKIRWAFNLYDINRDGCITREEMTDIVTAVYDLMGKVAEPCIDDDTVKEKVDMLFSKMDKNKDGVVTLDEFLECCKKDEDISSSMNVFDSSI
ncbi:hypothetical protein RI129_001200 [Pyrocoelia pectoralis]|uniref:EF-hand domain-containing protein n=1 Tax=Pyrocoelia pectoralis TaxID=417401 RepID=A0AAN7VT56_9COLE